MGQSLEHATPKHVAPSSRLARLERPDRDTAIRQYRSRAAIYDLELALAEPIRRRAISRLGLKRGQAVIDVGCGTGMSFGLLERAIGTEGRIIAIEQSLEMLGKARARVEERGWRNVTLIHSPVENAAISGGADGAVFHFTHDIMRTPAAVENVIGHLRPQAGVVATGLKWGPAWLMPLNLAVLAAAIRSTTALEGLARPWSHLERFVPGLEIEELFAGGIYIASGVVDR